MRDRDRLRGLYAVTPDSGDTDWLARRVEACIAGGAALVQYRAKRASAAVSLVQARTLADVCRAMGVPLIVNDSLELAVAVGAAGVHLGRDDPPVREARILLPEAIIGASCYADPELRARAAAAEGADYVAVGSMFASGTKTAAPRAPLEAIAKARAASGLPVAAIGGITEGNAAALVGAGADMVAVIAGLFEAPDTQATAARLARLFQHPPGGAPDARTQPQPV